MVLQSDFPPDIRVEKEMKAISNAGYSVHLLANNRKNRSVVDKFGKAIIYRLKSYRFLGRFLGQKINFPVPINPVWIWPFFSIVRKNRIRVVHIHDLPFALFGILGRFVFGTKFVLDLHENYPAALALWGKKGSIISCFFRNAKLAEIYEKISCHLADQIIVVAPEHKDYLFKKHFIHDKVHVVGNTVEFGVYEKFPLDKHVIEDYKNYFVVSFLGQFGPERDLDVAIRSIKFMEQDIPNLKMLFIGDGILRDDLRRLIHEEGVEHFAKVIGWVPFEKTNSYLAASNVCMIPQGSNDLIDNGTPHKLFQYMAMGKPVVVSDAKALKHIVEETKCGEIFRSKSPESFARAVLKIKNNPNFPYGENGIRAVKEKYNWDRDAQMLRILYEEIFSK